MFSSGKYKWSLVAVAILLLLAFYRNQVAKQGELEDTQPAVHEMLEPQFAAIPQPVGRATDDFVALQPPNQVETRESEESSTQETPRFAMSTDGGDFQVSQFSPSQNQDELTVSNEPELLTADVELAEINQAYTNAKSQNFAPRDERAAVNSAPLGIEDTNSNEQTKSFESVPDFEPTFARPADGPVGLPRGVLVKVVNHIEYGKSLARRGAGYGARQEFLAAVKLVALTFDQMQGGDLYSSAFFDAIQALRESDEFYKAQAEQHRKVDVVAIAERHQSKVAEPDYFRGLNPMQAMQMYYDYVQDKLVACSGHTVVAGEALYCLGKLHQVNAKDPIDGSQLDNAKSVVFYNAALNCDPKNYKSANELGVVLARSGRLDEAKSLFLRSLKVHQISKVWSNLASVHKQLGETELARLADVEYQRMLEGPAANRIIWVQPESFANQNNQSLPVRTAAADVAAPRAVSKQKPVRGLRNMMKKLF